MNPAPIPQTDEKQPEFLHGRAMDNLSYIRDAMATSKSFTGVPGWGMVAMGVVALIGGWLATRNHAYQWAETWFAVGVIGCTIGVAAMALKSRQRKTPVLLGPGRKFMLNFCPPVLAGCVLSEIFYEQRLFHFMPGTWLLLYGAAVINGGAFSVALVPIMGVCFMLIGAVTFFLPDTALAVSGVVYPYDIALAIGFGGLHIIFGIIIALRHGG